MKPCVPSEEINSTNDVLLPFWGAKMEFHLSVQLRKVLKVNLCSASFSPVTNEGLVFLWNKHNKLAHEKNIK